MGDPDFIIVINSIAMRIHSSTRSKAIEEAIKIFEAYQDRNDKDVEEGRKKHPELIDENYEREQIEKIKVYYLFN